MSHQQNRKLFNYYQLHVATVLWASCDRATNPVQWQTFYQIYRLRQDLDIWDIERNEWGGEVKAEIRRKQIVTWLNDLDESIPQIPANDDMLMFYVQVNGRQRRYELKPILQTLRGEVDPLHNQLSSLAELGKTDGT